MKVKISSNLDSIPEDVTAVIVKLVKAWLDLDGN